jgi:hypothetical protein
MANLLGPGRLGRLWQYFSLPFAPKFLRMTITELSPPPSSVERELEPPAT